VIIVITLIYVVSFEFELPAYITIRNQCLNTVLAPPVYFGNGAVCSKLPNQQIGINTGVRIRFEINTIKNKFEGVLLFKLKKRVVSDGQHNIDTSATEADKNEATHVHMLVIWEVKDAKSFAYVALVEHAEAFTWDKNRLKQLYDKNHGWLKKYNDITLVTWFMNNNMALKTKFNVGDLRGNPELSISISEEKKNNYAMRPFCINLER
jgi:hypothetical protein